MESGVVGGGFALRKAGKVVAGDGGKCGEGEIVVNLAPQLWRGPITFQTEFPLLGDVEAEEP